VLLLRLLCLKATKRKLAIMVQIICIQLDLRSNVRCRKLHFPFRLVIQMN